MLQPATSALVMVGDVAFGRGGVYGVIEAMLKYQGTVMETDLPKACEQAVDRFLEESAGIDRKVPRLWLDHSEFRDE